jgi:hypothetical protein
MVTLLSIQCKPFRYFDLAYLTTHRHHFPATLMQAHRLSNRLSIIDPDEKIPWIAAPADLNSRKGL